MNTSNTLQEAVRNTIEKYGLPEETVNEVFEKYRQTLDRRIGIEMINLVGDEGVEEVKQIQREQSLSNEDAVMAYISANPLKYQILEQRVGQISTEVIVSLFEDILTHLNAQSRHDIALELTGIFTNNPQQPIL